MPQTVGVGHNPDPFPLVRCAGMDSAEHSPARIIPHRGQVAENTSKPARSESWGVFHKHVARSHLANDSCHFRPQAAALAVESAARSCNADVLAREAARDDIHQPSPWLSVEGSHVVPDREGLETAVVLSGHEHPSGIGIALDRAHSPPAEQSAAENAPSSACEKCQLIHATSFPSKPAASSLARYSRPTSVMT